MIPLYRHKEKPAEGFILDEGILYFEFPSVVPRGIEVQEVLVGTIERLLPADHHHKGSRLFGLSVDDHAKYREVSLTDMNRRMREYHYGFQTNTFFSIALQMVNEAYLDIQDRLPEPMKSYQVRARIFARIINHLSLIAQARKTKELVELASSYMGNGLYQEGAALIRENKLANPQLPSVAMNRYLQEFREGEVLCKEGDTAHAMFALLSGKIGVVSGAKHIAEISLPGEAFGEASLFLEGERTATLIAKQKSAVYKINQEDLPDFHKTHPEMFLIIARTLALRIADTADKMRRVLELSFETKSGSDTVDWRAKDSLAENQLERLYGEIDTLQTKLKLPELQELWGKFIAKQ